MSDALHAVFFVSHFRNLLCRHHSDGGLVLEKKGPPGHLQPQRIPGTGVATGFCYKMVDGRCRAFHSVATTKTFTNGALNTSPYMASGAPCYFLIADFAFCWMHLATHKIGWFWASHRFHHSGEHELLDCIAPEFLVCSTDHGDVVDHRLR